MPSPFVVRKWELGTRVRNRGTLDDQWCSKHILVIDGNGSRLLSNIQRKNGRGIKSEGSTDEATIRFDFRASTLAILAILAIPVTGRGAKERAAEDWVKHLKRVELKKFSLWPEKSDGKGNFEGWVNQFKEYTTRGQWSDDGLFLSLVDGMKMYFVRLQEQENMAYLA